MLLLLKLLYCCCVSADVIIDVAAVDGVVGIVVGVGVAVVVAGVDCRDFKWSCREIHGWKTKTHQLKT